MFGCSRRSLSNFKICAWFPQDELKKLYAQLEVYKCKKMLANNPHLHKKRNSKKGLGRSLMKRITEIPENMHIHRQCSREDGSEHGSNRSTLRRNPFESGGHQGESFLSQWEWWNCFCECFLYLTAGKLRDDSLKNKLTVLKKSLSFDHICDPDEDVGSQVGEKMTPVADVSGAEGSLLGSLIGHKHTKKKLEPAAAPPKLEPAESTESVPLFWKSASAHNLTHEKKPVQLRTSIMQKSLSVISSAKEKMPGLTSKTQSVEDASKKGVKGQEERTLSEVDETPEHFPKMSISQSVEYSKTPLKMGIMKQQVTEEGRAGAQYGAVSSPARCLLFRLFHQVSGSQPSICSETGRNLYDVSEVCPWELEEPQTPTEVKAQKHVSIAPGENGGGGRRGSSNAGVPKGSRSQQRQKAGQSPSSRRRSRDKGDREERKSRAPRSPLPLKLDVCPWQFEEQPMLGGDSDSISPDRIRRKKSVTPTDGKPKALHSDHSKSTGSLLQPPSLMVEICPWDYAGPPSPKQEKSCKSPSAHRKKRKGSCSSNHKSEKEKGRERRSSSSKPPAERRRVSQSSECSGLVSERRRSSTRDPEMMEVRRSEVYPRDPEPSQGNKSAEKKRESSSSSYKPAVRADVCPWDFQEQGSGERP